MNGDIVPQTEKIFIILQLFSKHFFIFCINLNAGIKKINNYHKQGLTFYPKTENVVGCFFPNRLFRRVIQFCKIWQHFNPLLHGGGVRSTQPSLKVCAIFGP